MNSPRTLLSSAAVFSLLVLLPPTAQAYVDPNAGGLLYQLLFPIGVMLAGFWSFLRQRVVGWARVISKKVRATDSRESPKEKPCEEV